MAFKCTIPAAPTIQQEDEAVRITRWDFAPGAVTGWHRHGWPYVVVMLFQSYGPGGVVLVLSGLYLTLAIVVALFGIETNQQSLEDLAPDAEPPVEAAIVLENKRV